VRIAAIRGAGALVVLAADLIASVSLVEVVSRPYGPADGGTFGHPAREPPAAWACPRAPCAARPLCPPRAGIGRVERSPGSWANGRSEQPVERRVLRSRRLWSRIVLRDVSQPRPARWLVPP